MSQYPAKQAVFGERLRIPSLPELPSVALPPLAALPDLSQASQPPQEEVPQAAPVVPRPKRPSVDALVAANRAKTPAAAIDNRTKPRLSISELNEMDTDELRDRYLNSRYDNRTPIQQVLDIIDLPRNAIANVLFHDAADKSAQAGEFGTFGIPKVTTSDALRGMGVENRVALALGGFVGDVLLDPLLYLGPAGWGVQAGKIAVRAGGTAAIKSSMKQAASGGLKSVSDDATRELLRAAGVGEKAMSRSDISKAVYGDFSKGKIERTFRMLGGERTASGGIISKYADAAETAANVADHAKIRAVKNWVSKYGRGTGGGIKIGGGGSEILHVPFGGKMGIPELTVQVPGFTPTGKRSVAVLQIAKDRQLGEIAPELSSIATDLGTQRGAFEAARVESDARVSQIEALTKQQEQSRDPAVATQLWELKDQHAKALEAFAANAATGADAVRGKIDTWLANPRAARSNPNSILAARDKWQEIELLRRQLLSEHDLWKKAATTNSALTGEINEEVFKVTDTLNRMSALMGDTSGTVKVSKFQRVEGELVDSLRPDDEYIPPPELATISDAEYEYARKKLVKRYRSLPKNNPHRDDIAFEIDLLDSQATGGQTAKASPLPRDAITRGLLRTTEDGTEYKINADPRIQAEVFAAARPLVELIENDSAALAKLQSGGKVDGEDIRGGMQGLFRTEQVQSPEDIAKINTLNESLAQNRELLRVATAPLRERGPFQTVKEFEEQIRQNALARLDKKTQEMYDLAQTNPKLASEMADAYSKLADTTQAYRDAIGGTIGMHLSGPARDMVKIAGMALGTDDQQVALSSIGQFASAVRGVTNGDPNAVSRILEAIDRKARPLFGARHGENASVMAHVRAQLRNYAAAGAQMGQVFHNSVKMAVVKAGITDPKFMDDAGKLTGMYLHLAQDIPGARRADSLFRAKVPVLDSLGKETGDIEPSKLVTDMAAMLRFLRERLGSEKTRVFLADIKKIAQDTKSQLDQIRDTDERDFLLNYMLPHGYVPHTLAADTAQMLKVQKQVPEWQAGGVFGGPRKETFQHRRMSWMYQFPDLRPGREGKVESFFEGDRWVMDLGEKRLKALPKDELERVMELRERIERYDRMPGKQPPKPLSLQDLNEYIRKGRFAQFAEGKTTPFFEERLPIFMANRIAANERAKAMQDLLTIRSMEELPIDGKTLATIVGKASHSGEQTLTLPTGETATVRIGQGRNGGEAYFISARGKTWRSLDKSLLANDENVIVKLFGDSMKDAVVSESMADYMEDVMRVWKDDNIAPMLSTIANATTIYRSITLFHPSWFINDFIGNFTLMAQGGINVVKWAKLFPLAILLRFRRDNPEAMAALKVVLDGQEVGGDMVVNLAREARVMGHSNADDILLSQMFMGGNEARPSRLHSLGIVDGVRQDTNWRMGQWMGKGGNPSQFRKGAVLGMAGADIAWDGFRRRVLTPWVKANSFMNDAMRLAAYMTLLDEGQDAASAASKIRKAMYDFQNMTQFEQKFMRTAVPFYTWARSNLSYQVRQLFNDPKWAAAFPKLHTALEEALVGEQAVPEGMRPSWMRAALATQVGTDPNSRYAVMLGNAMPQLEGLNLLQSATGTQGAMNAGRYLLSQGNPIVSVWPQLASGTEFFSGRSITGVPGTGDTTAGEFLANSIRPLAEYGPGGRTVKAFERGGPVQGISRALGGGRVQAFDEDRVVSTRSRELRDEVEGLRRGITKAERNGDKKTSLRSRAKLLTVYQEAMRLGLEKEVQVPKWAQRTIQSFAEVPVGG